MTSENYSAAYAVAAEGARIGFVNCLRCGSTVMLSMLTDATKKHDDWHDTLDGSGQCGHPNHGNPDHDCTPFRALDGGEQS